MKKISLRVLSLLSLLSLVTTTGLVLANTNDTIDNATLNQIAGYRQWTRVNKKPVEVDLSSVRIAATPAEFSSIAG